jgi:sec-independent protein translocase protein TatC
VEDKALPLTAHLAELRTRLFRIVIAWVAGSVLAWSWREEIFAGLLAPALAALEGLGKGNTLQAIAPTEIFFTYLQCALLAGFALALPVFFWQIWAFVAPGLYPQEKRVALPFVLISTLLFAGGAAFGHQVVFPVIFTFFASFSSEFVQAAWTMREVFGFTTRMILAFGTGFELPVVVYFLALAGVVEPRRLLAGTKYFVLIAFIVGGVLTPPDPLSQSLLAGPLIVLYLLGVGAAYLFVPKRGAEPSAASLPTVIKR